jgi:hypothetical protein
MRAIAVIIIIITESTESHNHQMPTFLTQTLFSFSASDDNIGKAIDFVFGHIYFVQHCIKSFYFSSTNLISLLRSGRGKQNTKYKIQVL